MELTNMNVAYTLGRILLPILFIVLGIQRFVGVDALATTLTGYVPLPAEIDQYLGGVPRYVALAYIVAGIEIVCAVMIILGFKARWAALVLIIYAACTIFFVHNFWDMEGAAAVAHRLEALTNLSIIGGLLLVVAIGAGPGAMDRR